MNAYIDELNFRKLTLPDDIITNGAKIINNVYCKVQTLDDVRVFESMLIKINNIIIGVGWPVDRHYHTLAKTLMRFSYNFRPENIRRHYATSPNYQTLLAVSGYRAICMRMFVSVMGRYCRIDHRFMRYTITADLFSELPSLTSSQIVQIINYFASYKHVVWRVDMLRRIRSQFHEMFLMPVKKLANYTESMMDEVGYADINDISLYVIIIVLLIRYRRCSQLSYSDCSLITAITAEAFGRFPEPAIVRILHRDRSVYDSIYRKNAFCAIPYSCWDKKTGIRTDRYVERVYSAEHDAMMLSIMLGSSSSIVAMLTNTNRQTMRGRVVYKT